MFGLLKIPKWGTELKTLKIVAMGTLRRERAPCDESLAFKGLHEVGNNNLGTLATKYLTPHSNTLTCLSFTSLRPAGRRHRDRELCVHLKASSSISMHVPGFGLYAKSSSRRHALYSLKVH